MSLSSSQRIIDCDVHCNPKIEGGLERFIPAEFKMALDLHMASAPGHGYVNPGGSVYRKDCGYQSPEDFDREHLERYNLTYAVLQPHSMDVGLAHSIDVGTALAMAANDWLVEYYLSRDSRYLGSICINTKDPAAAAKEIDRMAGHPQMVQVLVPGQSDFLYGHRFYDPIYKACERNNLVFAIHPGAEGSYHSSTPVGRPSSYFEWHTSLPLTFIAHAASMVIEGVFEKFPGLKVLLTEGGYGWLAPFMWRIDKNFKGLRATTPWLKEAPSEYILRHIKLTTQPVEEPPNPEHALQIMEMIHAEKTLCFSSDFPHWDFDDPFKAFPSRLSPELLDRILWGNAYDLYEPRLAPLERKRLKALEEKNLLENAQ